MDRVNLGPLHDATQDRSSVIPFLRRDVAELRERARRGIKTTKERQALIAHRRRVTKAVADLE